MNHDDQYLRDYPYVEIQNTCCQKAPEIVPEGMSYFQFGCDVISENPDVLPSYAGYTVLERGIPDVMIRVGYDESVLTDGSDNCYLDFLCDSKRNTILAYCVVKKVP